MLNENVPLLAFHFILTSWATYNLCMLTYPPRHYNYHLQLATSYLYVRITLLQCTAIKNEEAQ